MEKLITLKRHGMDGTRVVLGTYHSVRDALLAARTFGYVEATRMLVVGPLADQRIGAQPGASDADIDSACDACSGWVSP